MAPNEISRRPVSRRPAQPSVAEQVLNTANSAVRLYNNEVRGAVNEHRRLLRAQNVNAPALQTNAVGRNFRAGLSVYDTAASAARLPGQTVTATRDVRNMLRNNTQANRDQAARSTREAISTARDLAENAPRARQTLRIANRTLTRVAPRTAAVLSRPATRLAATSTARLATRVAAPAARLAGRSAARFVPGANIAIAALDAREAVRTLRDPNASVGRRWTSVITAIGSAAAATNIPIVSQVGAGVATVSSATQELAGFR